MIKAKSARAKGKRFEDFIAEQLQTIDSYAYRRRDSGSGKSRKEDVFTRLPLFIECKDRQELSVNSWWTKTVLGCPANKYPVLIYKQNYQKDPTVVITLASVLDYLYGNKTLPPNFMENVKISLQWSEFFVILKEGSVNYIKD